MLGRKESVNARSLSRKESVSAGVFSKYVHVLAA